MLLDFGLRILKGDISTDGKWCFIIFKVCLSSGEDEGMVHAPSQPRPARSWSPPAGWGRIEKPGQSATARLAARRRSSQQTPGQLPTESPTCLPATLGRPMHAGVPPRWQLLKSRLEGICPTGTDTLQQLWRWRSLPKEQPAFLLQVVATWLCCAPAIRHQGNACAVDWSCQPCVEAGCPCSHLPAPVLRTALLCASNPASTAHHPCPTGPQVAGYDRQGMLHSLSHALWESDTTVSQAPALMPPAWLGNPTVTSVERVQSVMPSATHPPARAELPACPALSIRPRLPHPTCPLHTAAPPPVWPDLPQVFKAHITTSPNGKVADMFWLYDNRNELPENHRVLEVCDRVKGALGPDTGWCCGPGATPEWRPLAPLAHALRLLVAWAPNRG